MIKYTDKTDSVELVEGVSSTWGRRGMSTEFKKEDVHEKHSAAEPQPVIVVLSLSLLAIEKAGQDR